MNRRRANEIRRNVERAAGKQTDEEALESVWMFPKWEPGAAYTLGERIRHGDTLYRIEQPTVTAIASQPPDSPEMLAVYRPIVPDHSGEIDDPIPFVYGMNVEKDRYYRCNGEVYLAKAAMIPCVWNPDSGNWQWEQISQRR